MNHALRSLIPALLLTLSVSTVLAKDKKIDLPLPPSTQDVSNSTGESQGTTKREMLDGVELVQENISQPLSVRIVRIEKVGNQHVLYEANKTLRLRILDNEKKTSYYNSAGMQMSSWVESNGSLLEEIARATETTHQGCPLDITINRETLTVEKVTKPFCREAEMVKLVAVKTGQSYYGYGTINFLNADGAFILRAFANGNETFYLTTTRPNPTAMSSRLFAELQRAVKSISEQCPIEFNVDSVSGRLRKVKVTCDTLALAPSSDNQG